VFLLFFVLDALYFLLVTCIFSVFLYTVNNGGFRSYLLAGCICGFLLYLLTAGRVVMAFSQTMVNLLKRGIRILVWVPLCFVLRQMKRWIVRILSHTFGKLLRMGRRWISIRRTEKIRQRLHEEIRLDGETEEGRDL